MIRHGKKKGFTVMELVIVMTLTVVVLGIIWTMFSTGNKIISDVIIKSDLQREGQSIQEKLSNIGMQAIGIEYISEDNSQAIQTQTIKMNSYYKSEDSADPFYIIYDETNKKLYTNDKYNRGDSNLTNINNQLLLLNKDFKLVATNVDNIKINDEDINAINDSDLKNMKSVELTITLSKNRNYNNEPITHSINVRAVFRNKDITGN